jgi:hypothetical protein
MLIKEITPEARLVGLDCYFDQYRKVKSLHIRVAVANQSSRQQRFRVNIFLPDGKAVGGLLPRKAGTGLVKPGETVSFTYPIKGLADAPRQMTLQVMAMGRLTTMRSFK